MKVFYIAHEPTKVGTGKDAREQIMLEIHRANDKPLDPTLVLSWERSATGDWETPRLSIDQSLTTHGLIGMLAWRFSQFIKKAEVNLNVPDEIVSALDKTGSKQAIYDPRVKKIVVVDEIERAHSEWLNVDTGLTVTAETAEDAQKKLTKIVMTEMEKEGADAAKLSLWFTNKKAVTEKKRDGKAPKIPSMMPYLSRAQHGQLKEAEATAAKTTKA